jgi:positive phototaxis protein PixI
MFTVSPPTISRESTVRALEASQKFLSLHLPPQLDVVLSTQQLSEILPLTAADITPIPESATPVMGVYNWRGDVLWLLDLGYLLEQTPLFQQGYQQLGYSVIVIQFQQHAIGLVVNKIGEIQNIAATDIDFSPQRSPIPGLSQGCYTSEDQQQHWVLDVDALLERVAQSL